MSEPAPIKLDRKAIFGWSMFDFANSSFTTVMVTAYFSLYFSEILVPAGADGGHEHGYNLWGIANAVSQIIVIATAPLLGALADFSGSKKKFLFISYIGCCLLTVALGFVTPGKVLLGMTIFIVANFFYSSGENFVGGFLPEIAPPEKMGWISGMAWGIGYIGGIGALILSVVILGSDPSEARYRFVWMMMGAWFFLAGIPTFLFVKERHQHETMPPGQNIATVGFFRLGRTLKQSLRFRQLFKFLFIFVLIYAGLQAVVSFASIIARHTLDFSTTQLGIFLIVTNLVAVGGAFGWGWLQDKIGSRWAIILSLAVWVIALGLVLSIKEVPEGSAAPQSAITVFWIAGCFVGIGMGATSSSCRALVGLFSPEDRAGEFFGLWGLFGKLGCVVGPWLFGFMTERFDMRQAIMTLGSFFIISAFLMLFINEKEGRAAARAENAELSRQ